MVITNRDLPVGTRLVGKYKKQTFVCEVGKNADGALTFAVGDKTFKSPSSAASAVMGGGAVNGWRFWGLEGEAAVETPEKPAKREAQPKVHVEKAPKAKAERKPRAAKAFKLFDKVEAKDGDPEGSSRFWCHGCQDSFVSETDKPEACAQGHRADDAELTSAPAPEAVAAEREAVEA